MLILRRTELVADDIDIQIRKWNQEKRFIFKDYT